MRVRSVSSVSLLFIALLGLTYGQAAPSNPSGAPQAADTPIAALPYTPGLDTEFMDRSADPCVDFYQYSCGGWMKKNPIPADQADWGVYGKLAQDNQRFLWGILDDLARNHFGPQSQPAKIGDYFAACMDESAVEKLGAAPLKPHLDQINGLTSKKQLPALLAQIHLRTEGSGMFFGFGSNQDYGDSTQVIAFATLADLGFRIAIITSRAIRNRKSCARSMSLTCSGCSNCWATSLTQHTAKRPGSWRMETALAKASLTRVERREPHNLYHKMDLTQLQALTPGFDWSVYLKRDRTRATKHIQRN